MHRCTSRRAPTDGSALELAGSSSSSSGGPSYQGPRADSATTLSPWSAETGTAVHRYRRREGLDVLGEFLDDPAVLGVVPADQVHLVDRQDDASDADEGGDVGVAAGLLDHAVAGVDEDHGHVCDEAAVTMLACMGVSGRIGHDEASPGSREVAVGDVDGD